MNSEAVPRKDMPLEPCSESCRLKYQYENGRPVECGCGRPHKIEPFGNAIVHYYGKHWLTECLLKHLVAKREEDTCTIQLVTRRIKKYQEQIANLWCESPGCLHQVGTSYRIVMNKVYCLECHGYLTGQGRTAGRARTTHE